MYTAPINRRNPSALVFLLDQSGSMSESFGGSTGETKADFLATAVNRQLHDLVIRCTRDEGIRHYFDVAVIGYGTSVRPALQDGQHFVPVSTIGESPLRLDERTQRVPDGVGGLVEQIVRVPQWLDPTADGPTPMCDAIREAHTMLAGWIDQHPDAFPPCVINVTDGDATDGDPTGPAEELRTLATRDGSVILLNVHISSTASDPLQFPNTEVGLPDQFSRRLYQMSSVLPDHLVQEAAKRGHAVTEGARGFMYNANDVALTEFLIIGTTTPSPNELR